MKNKIITLATMVSLVLTLNAKAFVIGKKPPLKKVTHASAFYPADEFKKNLEYDFSKAAIRTAYYDKLDQLAKLLIEKGYALALRGYADSIGNYKSNWNLSDKRALGVKEYLVKKGVKDSRIVTTPFGSTKPVATNKTPEGRQRNRRVEIKINDTK